MCSVVSPERTTSPAADSVTGPFGGGDLLRTGSSTLTTLPNGDVILGPDVGIKR